MEAENRPSNETPIEVSVDIHIDGLSPVSLRCSTDHPSLTSLMSALSQKGDAENSLLYIQYGEDDRVLYFPRSRLVAIEIIPETGR